MKPAEGHGVASPPANRRVEERVAARFEVRFEQTQDAARALRAYSLNLSAGGLCLRTRRPYELGSQVHLSMAIDGEAFKLEGVIAWVRDEAIGVRFVNMGEPDRVRLQRVVESLKR
ncbi:TIGR02266 family protein [Myxococcaceae bacterium GXIMD 01537]